jgi:hypothetical protein
VARKATFLESYEWTTVPWSISSTPKSIYDNIVDLCAQVPRILEMLDQMHITRPEHAGDPEFLLSACWKLDNELQSWYRELVATRNNLSCTDSIGPSHHTQDYDQPLTAETEIDHEHAQALSVYWTTCSFLYTTIRLVWQACDNPIYLLPHRIDPLRYVSLISRSMPYFSKPSAGEGRLLYYAISIGAALHCLAVSGQLSSPDAGRLQTIFSHLEDPRGIRNRVGQFLATLAAASVESNIRMETVTREEITGLGKKWWGGGANEVTLRPRTPVVDVAAGSWQESQDSAAEMPQEW